MSIFQSFITRPPNTQRGRRRHASTRRTIGGLARTIPWAAFTDEERRGALTLVYEQLDVVAIVSLLDDAGNGVGTSVLAGADPASRHPALSPDALTVFARAIPFAEARLHGSANGDAVVVPATAAPLVPIAFAIGGPAGAKWTLAVGLSLRAVCMELAQVSPPGVSTRLEDASGQVLCGAKTRGGDLSRASAALGRGWLAVAEQPSDEALASLHRIRRQSVFWVALGVAAAIAAGLVLTQVIRRPLRKLADGADAVAAGDLAHRVGIASRDEFGKLALSFNRMSGEIARNNAEIENWNAELQGRVGARTAELKDAQDQLLQSRKLAAMAALGADVAHEINDPLSGVLGMAQILLARKDQFDERAVRSLQAIEREALRVRDIVERMSNLAQESVRDAVRVDVTAVVEAAAVAHAERCASGHIEIERAFGSAIPPVFANAAQLQHAVSQLVDNSLKAMPSGGKLRLTVRSIEGELVAIEVQDSGRGIAPDAIDKIFEPFFTTKDDWRGAGLGLTLAYRIVEAHQGRIRASSKPGIGTTMTITLPAARVGAHLA